MYLISAYFDDESAAAIKHVMDAVYKATGNDFMIANQVPPHMTIGAFEQKNDEAAKSLFQFMTESFKSESVLIASVGEFFPYVIYLEAVQNRYLHEMSEMVNSNLKRNPETRINKFYKPFQWIPHITIAKTLDNSQMLKAFEVLQNTFRPFEAKIERFGLSKPNPHRDLVECRP